MIGPASRSAPAPPAQKGSIAASPLFEPAAHQAVKSGLASLSSFAGLGNYPPTVVTVGRRWAAQNQNGIRLSRVLERAHRWLFDGANREEALRIVEKYTKCDAETAQQLYD